MGGVCSRQKHHTMDELEQSVKMGGLCSSQKHHTNTIDESVKGATEPINYAKDMSMNSSVPLVISFPKVFDCYICLQPLSIPVFQCDNGHIVCSTCGLKLKNECQKCSLQVSSERCKGIENLLLSIEMACPNAKYGCKEKISHTKNRNHEEECNHKQCNCPLLGCNFVASSEYLSGHFIRKHEDLIIKFSYGHSFIVYLKSNDKNIFLQEKNDGNLLILNNSTSVMGNAINICYIDPKCSELEYMFDILVGSHTYTCKKIVQQFTSTTLSPSEFLFMIPFESFGALKLEICITLSMIQIVLATSSVDIPLMVKRYDTILDVKKKIFEKEYIPIHHQTLFLDRKHLEDNLTIADYNIQDKTRIQLVMF